MIRRFQRAEEGTSHQEDPTRTSIEAIQAPLALPIPENPSFDLSRLPEERPPRGLTSVGLLKSVHIEVTADAVFHVSSHLQPPVVVGDILERVDGDDSSCCVLCSGSGTEVERISIEGRHAYSIESLPRETSTDLGRSKLWGTMRRAAMLHQQASPIVQEIEPDPYPEPKSKNEPKPRAKPMPNPT